MHGVKAEENLGTTVYVEEEFPFFGFTVSSLGTSSIKSACFSLPIQLIFLQRKQELVM